MLTSRQNPTIKQLRKLKQPKERRKQAVLLLEGTHLIEAACDASYPLHVFCYTDRWQQRYPELCQRAIAQSDRSEQVSSEVLKSVASTVNPDGAIATAPQRRAWQTGQPSQQNVHLGILLETLQDPGNLGTIIRTAAATGCDGLWLSPDSVDLGHPKVLRASAGQWFRLPMATVPILDQVDHLKQAGVQIVATSATADLDYWQLDLRSPTVFLMGNEGAGLSDELISQADATVKIPLMPGVESLNVAISTALLLYEARRQRQSF